MSVYLKLSNVQKELKAPKNQYNSFGKYKYRSCEDILEAAKPLCIQNGLILTVSDEIVLVGERYYIKATASVIDIESGVNHFATALARESENKKGMDDSQITGTASSYARKYALNGLFCIDDTKDAESDEYKNQTNQSKKSKPTQIDKTKADTLVKKAGNRLSGVLKHYKIAKIEDMTLEQWTSAMRQLEKTEAKNA